MSGARIALNSVRLKNINSTKEHKHMLFTGTVEDIQNAPLCAAAGNLVFDKKSRGFFVSVDGYWVPFSSSGGVASTDIQQAIDELHGGISRRAGEWRCSYCDSMNDDGFKCRNCGASK